MQFLKILFWCLLAFVAAVFTIGNWKAVTIALPGGLLAEVNLPLLLLATFLLGYLPTHAYHLIRRWRLRQRLASSERQLNDVRAVVAAPVTTPAVPIAAEPLADATLDRPARRIGARSGADAG